MEDSKSEAGDENDVLETCEFDWTTYLEANTNIEATPESAFSHVEASLDSGVKEGMIVERPLDSKAKVFWLASIDSVFGPLLKLSWLGDEDLQEIWHDLTKEKIYPLGYCQMNKVKLEPPVKVAEMCPLWQTLALQYLTDVSFDTVSMHFLDDDGIIPIERIHPGMGVQVDQSSKAKILANNGGLLQLQDVLDAKKEELVFYNSPRLTQMTDPKGLKKPPGDLISKEAKKENLPKNADIEVLIEGKAYKAYIDNKSNVKVQDEIVQFQAYDIASPGTFLDTDENNMTKEKLPQFSNAKDTGFEPGQKLMILINKKEFHTSTIIKCIQHFLILKIDTLKRDFICSIHDPIIFPLSWCQTNGLKFHILKEYQEAISKRDQNENNEEPESIQDSSTSSQEQDGSWCPPIFFNYKCYSASFLSRARLAGLPKKVGPGSVQLVMREVLNLIIGSSFKSGSVLKRLEAKRDQASADFVIEELKGKSRVLNLKGRIEIPTKANQVDKYLREMCQKLSACPNLVSTVVYEGVCPADCHNRPKADFKVRTCFIVSDLFYFLCNKQPLNKTLESRFQKEKPDGVAVLPPNKLAYQSYRIWV